MKLSRGVIFRSLFVYIEATALEHTLKAFDSRAIRLSGIHSSLLKIVTGGNVSLDIALTAAQLDSFGYFAEYAAATYCANNNDNTPGVISCANDGCPRVMAADAVTVLEFNDGALDSAAVFGFVATDPIRSQIVVSFRGSFSVRNWIANVQLELVDTTICSSCKVHSGFNQAWLQRQAAVAAAVKSARATNPSYGLVITGHSLGGAVATIAGAYFRSSGLNCDIYSYGSPRVGNANFVKYVSSTSLGSTYRITHLNDPVPHVPAGGPFAWLTNYYHPSPEYWLSNGTYNTVNYAITDIMLCKGINNLDCAETVPTSNYNVLSHMHYLHLMTVCNPSFDWKE